MRRASGRITLVWTEEVTTTLTQDEAAAATVLHVDDASLFNDDTEADEAGNLGYLRVGAQVVGYTAVDDDASTVTLAEALAGDAEQDDDVAVWSDLYGLVDTRQWALVDPDGRGDKADLIQAIVGDGLELVDGDRGRAGEHCVLERESDSDEWSVTGVGGRPATAVGSRWEDGDIYTLTEDDITAGEFTFQLSHVPVPESVQAEWEGVVQPRDGYTYTPEGLVLWVLDGQSEDAGDEIRFHYEWTQGVVTPPVEPPLIGIHIWDYFDRDDLYEGAHKQDGSRPPWILGPGNADIVVPWHIDDGVLYPGISSAGETLNVQTGEADGEFNFRMVGIDGTNLQDDRVLWRVSADGKTGFLMVPGGQVYYFDADVDVIVGGVYNGGGDALGVGVPYSAGELVTIKLDGATMEFYIEGVLSDTLTDSRNLTETGIGFGTSDATPGTRGWDDVDFYGVGVGPGPDDPDDPPPPPEEEDPPPIGEDPNGPGPYVTPLASQVVHEGYGVCQHVNFQSGNVHASSLHQQEILDRYGAMHVAQMRSLYGPNASAAFAAAIAGCREHNVMWNALVATMNDAGVVSPSEATIRARITKMATDHADVIGWIEGINEPNQDSDPDWVENSLYYQWVIWDEWSQHPELDHVKILSPSMHDGRLDASDGAHWDEWANGSIVIPGEGTFTGADLCHMAAVHSYPAGNLPDTNRDDRVQWVYDAFGADYPIKFTEWGYTNALGTPRVGGHKVTSEAASAAYDAQAIFDFANNGWELLRYEMMDDPDADPPRVTEYNFGLYRVESTTGNPDATWTPKPSVAAITTVLDALEDRGDPYTVTDVTLEVEAVTNVRWACTQKRNGLTTLWLWRHVAMWDPIDEDPVTVGTVDVDVTDVDGVRTIAVGVMPVAVTVRTEEV